MHLNHAFGIAGGGGNINTIKFIFHPSKLEINQMKSINNWLLVAPLVGLLFACEPDGYLTGMERQLEAEGVAKTAQRGRTLNYVASADLIDPINGNQVVGSAMLSRHFRGVSARLTAESLIPGHTYTLWWVVFNNPSACQTAPCGEADIVDPAVATEILYADGLYYQPDSSYGAAGYYGGQFTATLANGDDTGSINTPIFGLPGYGGMLDQYAAEVHLIIRSHGPAIPGQIDDQIGSFDGGCTTNLPPFVRVPTLSGECADIQFAIFQAR